MAADEPRALTDVSALVREALARHPLLRSQLSLGEAARAGTEAAQWQFFPTPSVSVEQASTDGSDPSYRGDGRVTTLRLQQPLWTGGRLTGNLQRARARERVALADVEIARQQLALQVIQHVSEAAAASRKLDAFVRSRATHARLLAQVERRAAEGASAHADVVLARSRLDAIEAEVISAEAQRDTALYRLQLLVNRPVIADELDDRMQAPDPGKLPEPILRDARTQSPLLLKSRAQASAAEADVDVARSALSPELYVRAERQYGNFFIANGDPENRVFVGVGTAFGGGLSSLSGIEAARAQHRAAVADIQIQQLGVDEQVLSDWTLYRAASSRRIGLERSSLAAAAVVASWERQVLAGRKQWQDLMNAARDQAQADAQLADALGAQYLSAWRLLVLSRGLDALLRPDGNR